MGLFSKPNPPIGFHHFLGTHSVLCKGPIDYISRIRGEDKTVWEGLCEGGEIFIDAVDAFGGQYDGEGGVLGWLDIDMGAADQEKNRYLQGALGTTKMPAHRGVVSAIQKQMYVGITKYPKPLKYLCTRTKVLGDGEPQWYPEKATIFVDGAPVEASYEVVIDAKDSNPFFVTKVEKNDLVRIEKTSASGAWSPYSDDINPSLTWMNDFRLTADGFDEDYWNIRPLFSSPLEAAVYAYNSPVEVSDLEGDLYISLFDGGTYVDNRGSFTATVTISRPHRDLNPAHILRELDTSRYYGMRHPESDIDDDAFADAADTLFDEGMGFSYLWGFDGSEKSVNDFSNVICRHIDAIHAVSFQTGKLKLWLIRDDYDSDELPVFDASNVKRVLSAHCTSPHELVNKVTATYWDPAIGKTRTVCVSNPAAIANGAPVNAAPLDLTGFSSSRLAILGAQRELRSLGNQAWTFEIEVTRVGETVDFGSVVKLNLPNHKANNMIMRVMDIGIMDTDDATIKLVLSQDLYSLPEVPVVVQTPGYVDPTSEPQPVDPTLAIELPYWALVQREGQGVVDAALMADPGLGFVGVAGGVPQGTTGSELWIDSGDGYSSEGAFEFAPVTTLTAGLDRHTTIIEVDDELGIFGIEVGMIGSLNGELVACDSINIEVNPIEITLVRAVFDTLPAEHSEGDTIVWWSETYKTDEVQYEHGDTVSAKIVTRTASGSLSLSDATEESVEMDWRASRPYPPANVRINGEYWPESIEGSVVVAFNTRNRRLEVTSPLGWFANSDIELEEGATISAEFWLEGGIDDEIHEVTSSPIVWNPSAAGDAVLKVWSSKGLLDSEILEIPFSVEGPEDDYSFTVLSQAPWGYWRMNDSSGDPCTDSSGNNHNGTYVNATFDQPNLVAPGKAVALNGSNAYINFGSNLGSFSEFTLTCVVKFNSVSNERTLCNKWGTLSGDQNTFLCWFNSSARLVLLISNTSGTTFSVTSTTTLSTGTPYHIGLQVDNTAKLLKIYINGSLNNSAAFTGTMKVGTTKEYFAFGAKVVNNSPTDMTSGRWGSYVVDRIAFFTSALSDSDIADQYDSI